MLTPQTSFLFGLYNIRRQLFPTLPSGHSTSADLKYFLNYILLYDRDWKRLINEFGDPMNRVRCVQFQRYWLAESNERAAPVVHCQPANDERTSTTILYLLSMKRSNTLATNF